MNYLVKKFVDDVLKVISETEDEVFIISKVRPLDIGFVRKLLFSLTQANSEQIS